MDPVLLSRIQFGVTAGFHFLFPPITFGLTFIILILETLYIKKQDELYKNISSFFIKILGLVFTMGVATGIVLEFAFGTNWAEYSRMVGDIFGAPLAAEGILAFFLESVFIAVLIFGRNKVSKRVYWLSAFLVFFGSHLSGLWIIIANSWMQTPAGFEIEGGRAVLTNFWEAAINHSTIIRYIHVLIAGWITGAFFVAGISAWYVIKNQNLKLAKITLRISVIIIAITSILQLFLGHPHSVQVAKTQPEKMAAFEGLWETTDNAPLSLFGLPCEEQEKTYFNIGIPKLLSIFIYGDKDAAILGLKEFPKSERPPVLITYISYHVMISLGMLFILIGLVGIFLLIRNKIWNSKWFLWTLLCSIPLPLVANEFGWMAAEIGRQPWAVYRILLTKDAASITVPASHILFSLIMFSLIYILLFVIFMIVLLKIIRKGPEQISRGGY